jgi:radical SAM protein with 4Fe4S-binding SPASM domain
MCFYWEPIENSSRGEISLDEIEKISQSMPNFTWLLIGGGEPFIRKDLPEIVKIFYDNNNIKNVSIPTNATYPDAVLAATERILAKCPKLFFNLDISLNGLHEDHDEVCMVDGVFEKVEITYQKVLQMKKKYNNFGVGFNITCSNDSQDNLLDVLEYIKDNFSKIDNVAISLVRGRPKSTETLNVDINNYKAAVEKIETMVIQNKINAYDSVVGKILFIKDVIMRRIIARTSQNGYQIPCTAGKLTMVIDEKTNVYPCEMLPAVGNLRQAGYDFSKIYQGEKLKTAVKKIECENCFCTHECNYNVNVLFAPQLWPSFAKYFLSFKTKQLFGAKKFYDFDSVKLPNPSKQKSYNGQKGRLYPGTSFGIINDKDKVDATV